MNPRRPPWQGGTLPLSYSRKPRSRDRGFIGRGWRCQGRARGPAAEGPRVDRGRHPGRRRWPTEPHGVRAPGRARPRGRAARWPRCRSLAWPWSTHRGALGAEADPWVRAEELAAVLGRPARGFGEWLHGYVSGDPDVNLAGTPAPVRDPSGSRHPLRRVALAAASATPWATRDRRRRHPTNGRGAAAGRSVVTPGRPERPRRCGRAPSSRSSAARGRPPGTRRRCRRARRRRRDSSPR